MIFCRASIRWTRPLRATKRWSPLNVRTGYVPPPYALPIRRKSSKTIAATELPQGLIAGAQDGLTDIEADDAPQYPAVVQGARNNMTKYKDCVLLTRVGKFYEVCSFRLSTFVSYLF